MRRTKWKGKRIGYVAPEPFIISLIKYRAWKDREPVLHETEADLISSKLAGSRRHAPLIDMDGDVRVAATSPGHYHLYVDREVAWADFVILLIAMYRCGMIEKGFFFWTLRRGAAFLRYPESGWEY